MSAVRRRHAADNPSPQPRVSSAAGAEPTEFHRWIKIPALYLLEKDQIATPYRFLPTGPCRQIRPQMPIPTRSSVVLLAPNRPAECSEHRTDTARDCRRYRLSRPVPADKSCATCPYPPVYPSYCFAANRPAEYRGHRTDNPGLPLIPTLPTGPCRQIRPQLPLPTRSSVVLLCAQPSRRMARASHRHVANPHRTI